MLFRQNVTITTELDRQEITNRLKNCVTRTQFQKVHLGDYHYWGHINKNGFKFDNYVHPRFAFTVLIGSYYQNSNNMLIELELKVDYWVWWFVILIEGLVLYSAIGGDPLSPNNVIGYIFPFTFPLVLLYIKFRVDFKHAMKFINKIIDATKE